MSKSRKIKPNAKPPRSLAGLRLLIGIAVLAAGLIWWNNSRRADVPVGNVAGVAPGTKAPAVAAAPVPAALQRLKGRWLRPDGGYVVEIRNVETDGKLDVTYSNPRSIHVAKADAAQEGALTKVFIELRDVGYPGCTYNLTYDAANDQLAGIYFQAALQQQFEVIFERMK